MNAYEIADELDGRLDHKAANMLRQQADRIAELEKEKIKAYDNGYEDGQKANTPPKTYVFDGKQVWDTTPQIKELSDEDIEYITKQWFNCRSDTKLTEQFVMPLYSVVNLCKAILKKASEK